MKKNYLAIILISIVLNADTGILIKVVDGDTLHFKTNNQKVKCRTEYIDTPESYTSSKLKKDISQCNVSKKDMLSAGMSASRYAKSLLSIGKQYKYVVSGKDRYKRSICTVYLDEVTLFNDKMITAGYATIYPQYMNKEELEFYTFLLEDAKKQNVGLWKDRREVIECLDEARNITSRNTLALTKD